MNIEAIGEALNEAISMAESEKQLLHKNTTGMLAPMMLPIGHGASCRIWREVARITLGERCYAMGIGFGFRLVALDANFKKLEIFTIESAYKKSRNRAILLDYDGTVMLQTTINKTPSDEDCKQTL
ncbi:hypothetical protein GIB67_022634 [Kingdonia uniflora]|uniref:Uncharacterized protein n=1 Tax=Kingdonia uniflora TaxID=39325 RepID=A0A7J7P8M8_9MAGN|nr:hypothetical protein GIB67_022634 [Kingdonia uniflora]